MGAGPREHLSARASSQALYGEGTGTAVDGGALAKHREELDSYKGSELMTLAPLRAQEAVLQLVSSIAMLPASKWHAPLYLILSGLKPGNYP